MNFDQLVNSLNAEQKLALLNALQSNEGKASSKTQERKLNVSENFIVNRELQDRRGRNPVRANKNVWEDEGEKRDPNFNPEIYEKMGRTARNRKKPKKVEVECSVCGRNVMIDEQYVYGEYHRCNRCVGR